MPIKLTILPVAYLEFEIPTRSWGKDDKEILLAWMAGIGFDGFEESGDLLKAYIEESAFQSDKLNQLVDDLADKGLKVQYHFHRTPEQNWNEEWEKQFDPVKINERVLIRAPFHDRVDDLEKTLVIEPKMSFGTGHHHSTRLMLDLMCGMDLAGKRVLDMGCGTGVLGILAALEGAQRVLGVDNDQWAYENALENVERNHAHPMEVRLGDVNALGMEKFDIILANITRNILLRDLAAFRQHLHLPGHILLSGFLVEDAQYLMNEAYRCGLSHQNTVEDSGWIALVFKQ